MHHTVWRAHTCIPRKLPVLDTSIDNDIENCPQLPCESVLVRKAFWSLFMITVTVSWSNKKYFYFDIWSPKASQHFPACLVLGFKCKRKVELVRIRRKGGRSAHREPLFHLRATQFLVLQKNSKLTVCCRPIINFAWLAGLEQSLVHRASQGVLPHPWTGHSSPWMSQNTGPNNPTSLGPWTLAWLNDPFVYIIYFSHY